MKWGKPSNTSVFINQPMGKGHLLGLCIVDGGYNSRTITGGAPPCRRFPHQIPLTNSHPCPHVQSWLIKYIIYIYVCMYTYLLYIHLYTDVNIYIYVYNYIILYIYVCMYSYSIPNSNPVKLDPLDAVPHRLFRVAGCTEGQTLTFSSTSSAAAPNSRQMSGPDEGRITICNPYITR